LRKSGGGGRRLRRSEVTSIYTLKISVKGEVEKEEKEESMVWCFV